MTKRHLALFRIHHAQGVRNVNINDVHQESLSLNERVALWVSQHVGTMWFCYGLAALMLFWAMLQTLLGKTAWDASPYPFLFFVLGGVMQSLLLPLIMVAQNLDARHAELKSEAEYHLTQESFALLEQVIKQNEQVLTQLAQEQ